MYDLSKFKPVPKEYGYSNGRHDISLTITKDKMTLSAEAVATLGVPEYVWLGIDMENRMVLARLTNERDTDGTKLCRNGLKVQLSTINHYAFRRTLLKAIRKYDPAVVNIVLTGKPIDEVKNGLVFDYSMNVKTKPRRKVARNGNH